MAQSRFMAQSRLMARCCCDGQEREEAVKEKRNNAISLIRRALAKFFFLDLGAGGGANG